MSTFLLLAVAAFRYACVETQLVSKPPLFMGHAPHADTGPTPRNGFRWVYSFEGNWEEVSLAIRTDFEPRKYWPSTIMAELITGSRNGKRGTVEPWLSENMKEWHRGSVFIASIVIHEESIYLFRGAWKPSKWNWDTGDMTVFGREVEPGMVTVIFVRRPGVLKNGVIELSGSP